MTQHNARVLCFGGRHYNDTAAIDAALQHLLSGPFGKPAIINGGAFGADRQCAEWGRKHGLCVVTVFANWDYYSKAAGAIRNDWMLEFCSPTYAVGFPGGNGTRDMAHRLKQAGVLTWFPYGAPSDY